MLLLPFSNLLFVMDQLFFLCLWPSFPHRHFSDCSVSILGLLSERNFGHPIMERFSMILTVWMCASLCACVSRPVHMWLTALFDNSCCHGDLLNSPTACFLHLLFSRRTNECRLPGRLQWLPEWALNLQWKAANIPEWQERKRRKPTEKGKNKPEDGNETKQMTGIFNRISTRLSPFRVVSET